MTSIVSVRSLPLSIRELVQRDNSYADIDECSDDTHECHEDADCMNVIGSYSCTCKTGYTGDGFMCEGEINKQLLLFIQLLCMNFPQISMSVR